MAEYIQLEYIESTGTQYIDTGFKPNNNTRVVFDFEPLPASQLNTAYAFFGTRAAKEDGEYFAFLKASSSAFNLYWEFAELYDHIWDVADKSKFTVRRTVEANGATATIDGVTKTYPARTFQTKYSMYLLASNERGTANYLSYTRLYSCKIYDNGTLVRDFMPCKNEDGEIGLWDKVEKKFYGNAGTGTFEAGPDVIVPVEPIDYKAMVQGWIIGKRLAAMRKIVARPESEYVAVFAGGELYIKKAPAVMDGNVLSLSGLDL